MADKVESKESILIGGFDVRVPADVELKLKYNHKHEREKLSFKLTWPSGLSDDFSKKAGDGVIDHYRVPAIPPRDFKQLKKEMQHSLFYFRRLAETGESVPSEDMAGYRRLQAAFVADAKPKWREGIVESETATDELAAAVERGDHEAQSVAVTKLLEIKKVWHARYK